MAAIDWPAVVGAAPQMVAVSASFQADILNYVNGTLEVSLFGGEDSFKLRMARLMLAAHMGEVWIRRGQGGALTGETIAAQSVASTWAAPYHGAAIDVLETTSFGLEFLRLVATTGASLPMVW